MHALWDVGDPVVTVQIRDARSVQRDDRGNEECLDRAEGPVRVGNSPGRPAADGHGLISGVCG